MIKIKRYKAEDLIKNKFYEMPKFLLYNEFKGLSYGAKILYVLLKDRHKLSMKNNWVDKYGYIYLIYTRKDMAKMLNCSEHSSIKYAKELIKYKLIEEDRIGYNQSNRIYLTEITIDIYSKHTDIKDMNKLQYGHEESSCPDMKKVQPNKNNFNNNNSTKNKSVCSESKDEQSFEQKTETDRQTDIDIKNDLLEKVNINLKNDKKKDSSANTNENLKNDNKNCLGKDLKINTLSYPINFIKQHFKFNELISQPPIQDEIFAELHKILNYKSQTIKIGAKIQDEDIEIFKQKLMKLTPEDIQNVVNKVLEVANKEYVQHPDLLIRTKIYYQFKSSIKALSKNNAKRKPKEPIPTVNNIPQVPQERNYEQREYTSEYLESFYENYWDKHTKPE